MELEHSFPWSVDFRAVTPYTTTLCHNQSTFSTTVNNFKSRSLLYLQQPTRRSYSEMVKTILQLQLAQVRIVWSCYVNTVSGLISVIY